MFCFALNIKDIDEDKTSNDLNALFYKSFVIAIGFVLFLNRGREIDDNKIDQKYAHTLFKNSTTFFERNRVTYFFSFFL